MGLPCRSIVEAHRVLMASGDLSWVPTTLRTRRDVWGGLNGWRQWPLSGCLQAGLELTLVPLCPTKLEGDDRIGPGVASSMAGEQKTSFFGSQVDMGRFPGRSRPLAKRPGRVLVKLNRSRVAPRREDDLFELSPASVRRTWRKLASAFGAGFRSYDVEPARQDIERPTGSRCDSVTNDAITTIGFQMTR